MADTYIDIEEIKKTYAQMSSGELVTFAEKEAANLTPEAVSALKSELKKRNIDLAILSEIDDRIVAKSIEWKADFIQQYSRREFQKAVKFAVSEKYKGHDDADIYDRLLEMGIPADFALAIIENLDEFVEAVLKNLKLEMQAGIGILVVGIIVLYVTMQMNHFERIGWLLIIMGVIRIIISSVRKERYVAVLNNIKEIKKT